MCGNGYQGYRIILERTSDQTGSIDMDPLSRDSGFNVIAQGVQRGSNSLVNWLVG